MQERERVAQTDPEALRRWLLATGRKYLVFNGLDLMNALKWPEEHQMLQQIVASYRDHRQAQLSDRVERQRTLDGMEKEVRLRKGEILELDEKRELWAQLGRELGLRD